LQALGAAGTELAGGAKRAAAAKPEALEPGEYGRAGSGEARRGLEMLPVPREGKRMLELRPTPSLAIYPGLKRLRVCGGDSPACSALAVLSARAEAAPATSPSLVRARQQ